MKFQCLALALTLSAISAFAVEPAETQQSFAMLKARFSYGTSLKANSDLSTYIGSSMQCITVFEGPEDASRNAPWDPLHARTPNMLHRARGFLAITQSGDDIRLHHYSSHQYMTDYSATFVLWQRNGNETNDFFENFRTNSESPLVIVDAGVSIQVRQAADENGALLLRIHNYQVEEDARGAFRPEGYSVCRSLSRLSGPL